MRVGWLFWGCVWSRIVNAVLGVCMEVTDMVGGAVNMLLPPALPLSQRDKKGFGEKNRVRM